MFTVMLEQFSASFVLGVIPAVSRNVLKNLCLKNDGLVSLNNFVFKFLSDFHYHLKYDLTQS
jgi:hypothetical protein